jgi:uncharacterized membrane protein
MFIKLLLQSLIVFLTIDALWITQVAAPWMKKTVPHLLADKTNFTAAIIFYLLYLSILLVLILMPSLANKNAWQTIVSKAFLFGLAAYATYDLTNLSVMKNFPWTMAVADMFWGGLLTTLTTLIVWKINS